jgi:hypothetical protein
MGRFFSAQVASKVATQATHSLSSIQTEALRKIQQIFLAKKATIIPAKHRHLMDTLCLSPRRMAATLYRGVRCAPQMAAFKAYILMLRRMEMHSAIKYLYASLLLTISCDQFEYSQQDLRPLDAKAHVRGHAEAGAVAIIGAPAFIPCELRYPMPPATAVIESISAPKFMYLKEINLWLPPLQGVVDLPVVVEDPGSGSIPLSFARLRIVDLGAQDVVLRSEGFVGDTLELLCSGESFDKVLTFARWSIEELTKDGTTLDDMKAIAAETAKTAPIVDENRIVTYQGAFVDGED